MSVHAFRRRRSGQFSEIHSCLTCLFSLIASNEFQIDERYADSPPELNRKAFVWVASFLYFSSLFLWAELLFPELRNDVLFMWRSRRGGTTFGILNMNRWWDGAYIHANIPVYFIPVYVCVFGDGKTKRHLFCSVADSAAAKGWCKLAYWEKTRRVGRQFPVEKPFINIFWDIPYGDGLSVKQLSDNNNSCSPEDVDKARKKIGLGKFILHSRMVNH